MGRARSGMLRRSARVGYEEPAVVGLLLFSGGRLFFWCSKVFSLPGGRDGLGWPLRMTIPRVPGRAHHCCGQPLEWGSFRAPSDGEAVRELCACGGIS